MIILSIDSSTPVASVAVVDEVKVYGEYTLNTKNTHSEKLMSMIDRLLTDLDMDFADIDVIAVAQGPGSFTGLRIGMATAKALAQGGKKKFIAIPSLDGLAYNIEHYDGVICPILNAKKQEVYAAFYKNDNGQLTCISEYFALSPQILADKLKAFNEPVWFVGDGVAVYRLFLEQALGELACFAPEHQVLPRALTIGLLALKRVEKEQFDNYLSCQPLYIRKSEAEIQWEARQAKI